MKKAPLITIFLIATALLGTWHYADSSSLPRSDRKISLRKQRNEPISITDIKVKGSSVKPNEKFLADEDWLDGLVIRLKSESNKAILFATVDLHFPRPNNSAGPITVNDLGFGRREYLGRKPTTEEIANGLTYGQSADLSLSREEYLLIRENLRATDYPTSVENVNIKIGRVVFEDDSMWYLGLLLRRDESNPRTWINPQVRASRHKQSLANPAASASRNLMSMQNNSSRLVEAQRTPPFFSATKYNHSLRSAEGCKAFHSENFPYCFPPPQNDCQYFRDHLSEDAGNYFLASASVLCKKWQQGAESCGVYRDSDVTNECEDPPAEECDYWDWWVCMQDHAVWNGYPDCECQYTPVLVDVNGDGFALTDNAGGVSFDLNADGTREKTSWTKLGTDDAWLALDINGNGNIDDRKELFGNSATFPNGFLALAEYDQLAKGGNSDAIIDSRDAIFSSLRLWQDINHNGTSEPSELRTLAELDVHSISLDYKESKKTDEFGNQFRYRAKLRNSKQGSVGKWAWDVILLPQ